MAKGDVETNVGGGNDITSTLYKLKNPNWEQQLNAQLARRDEQEATRKLEEQKQADIKAEAARKAAEVKPVQQKQIAVPTVSVPQGGGREDWMAAAGIPQSDWSHVDFLVSRESGWNPNAVNKSSGACGLGQQLPCGKWAGAWNDPVAALRAMTGYVTGRYGGWAGAVAFWQTHHWY